MSEEEIKVALSLQAIEEGNTLRIKLMWYDEEISNLDIFFSGEGKFLRLKNV